MISRPAASYWRSEPSGPRTVLPEILPAGGSHCIMCRAIDNSTTAAADSGPLGDARRFRHGAERSANIGSIIGHLALAEIGGHGKIDASMFDWLAAAGYQRPATSSAGPLKTGRVKITPRPAVSRRERLTVWRVASTLRLTSNISFDS